MYVPLPPLSLKHLGGLAGLATVMITVSQLAVSDVLRFLFDTLCLMFLCV